jgi:predicted helicase
MIQATTSKQLAINLAKRTKLLASILELHTNHKELQDTKEAFKITLLHDIDGDSFINLISETFTYSLFIATLEHFNSGKSEDLTLTTAIDYIPKTIPILHDLYRLADHLSREIDIKTSVELILKELNSCAIEKIRNSFYKEKSSQEPILYFYETFLREYDKETKKKRGAYYTPTPIVDFIVKSVDTILVEDFALKDGFLNKKVKVLDPATGTGTFLASAIELVKEKIDDKYQILGLEKEQFIKEVSNHILHNFYAFEFMIAPYTVAHLKLTLLLKTLGFDFSMTANDDDPDNDRWKIYLANTLDDPSKEPNNLFGFNSLSLEGKLAKEVKNQKDIIAVIGNPPYNGSSQNPSRDAMKKLTWIGKQIESYKFDGSKKLDEKNPKWLQDDYVKFIRFAQFQIDNAGFGVIGYIVPHGFLDNPTFRYMRKSLMHSFTKIYILDLHGNDNKKEKDEQGNKDENVFDIKQGVCIAIFVKEKKAKSCEVYHGDLWGKRVEKFVALKTKTFKELCVNKLTPSGEMCYFIPRNEDSEYESFWSVKDIFKVSSVGIVTGNDSFLIADSKDDMILKIKEICICLKNNWNGVSKYCGLKSKDLEKFGKVLIDLICTKRYIEEIKPINYRPFDERVIFYVDSLVERSRKNVMKHMFKENLAFITTRQIKSSDFNHIAISNELIESCYVSNKTSEIGYTFPLYLYDETSDSLFGEEKTTNFTDEFREFKNKNLSKFSDEVIFYYIYGLLHSPTYRAKYNEFLKTDFPHIDFRYDIVKISKLGLELTQLHLLTHPIFEERNKWGLQVEGKDFSVNFAKKADIFRDNKIYLNPDTYIHGVDEATFKFMIGGYQVLDKWLSDRKNKILSVDELEHYMKIIVSLNQTIKKMNELKKLINLHFKLAQLG